MLLPLAPLGDGERIDRHSPSFTVAGVRGNASTTEQCRRMGVSMYPPDDLKTAARRLRAALAEDGVSVSHGRALDLVARQLGMRDWNICSARLRRELLVEAVAILRVVDAAEAIRFYRDHLGFTVEFEHRFAPDLPLYVRVRRGHVAIDLSEHHGDGTPGSVVWIETTDVRALLADLRSRPHPRLRPDVDDDAPGGPTLEVTDPWGNVVRFAQASSR